MPWLKLQARPGYKVCRGCGEEKKEEEFFKDKYTGRRPRCKICTRHQNDEWRSRNPKRLKELERRNNHRTNLRNRFGLSEEQFDALLSAYGRACNICGGEETRDRRLCLDHDHDTGRIRGFLCCRCNLMLGRFRDDPSLFERAAKYLRHPPIQDTHVKFLPGTNNATLKG